MQPPRVKVLLTDVDARDHKLLIQADWTVAALLARLRTRLDLKPSQALMLTCIDASGRVSFPAVTTHLADLPDAADGSKRCTLELQKAYG